MYPNTYLRTFWQMNLRDEVFVAMSFDPRYQRRYEDVIAPAIRRVSIGGHPLSPKRVDLSKTGDSILTDIMDGIAHSQMVLADVSTVGSDKTTGLPYRNENVMYEVGLALACRQPTEVLLLRDDKDKFLFDVSVIPHATVDFTAGGASDVIMELIHGRLRERDLINDARIQQTLASLGLEEMAILRALITQGMGPDVMWPAGGTGNSTSLVGIPRLLDRGILRRIGRAVDQQEAFMWTPLGYHIAKCAVAQPVFPLNVSVSVVENT
jgi:hypothetical protein